MKLYMLIQNSGDGSYSIRYTLDANLISKLENFDGDGFNPRSIEVPDGSTYESLGISQWSIAQPSDYEGLEE